MKLPCLFVAATLALVGCAEDDKRQLNEAMRDWNGDNMQMRNSFAGPKPTTSTTSTSAKSSLPDE